MKMDGTGYIASELKNARESQDQFVPQSGPIRGTGNGLGRTQRNQNSGCPTTRVPQPESGPSNNNNKGSRNKQDELMSEPDPMQMLTQVLKLLQNFPFGSESEGMLCKPKKSTTQLIVEC